MDQKKLTNETPKYRVPFRNRFARKLLKPLFRGLYYSLAKVNIIGLENIPRSKPYVIAYNHISHYEPPFILTFWPENPEPLGAAEVWRNPGEAIFANLYGGIPINRDEYDRQAIETILMALRNGFAVMMAPEGRISRKPGMHRAKIGIAYILSKLHVPVVPVGIIGTTQDFLSKVIHFQRPKLEMHIGRPFYVPPPSFDRDAPKRLAFQENADFVMRQIAALLPPEYRGEYSANQTNILQRME